MKKVLLLPLSKITRDARCQSRVRLDDETVREYADVLRDGGMMPRGVVYFDGHTYWLAEGYHRIAAHELAGVRTVEVEVRDGGMREAILHSVGSNAKHGLRPSPDDRRRAVGMLLDDRQWAGESNVWIANQCGVSEWLVRKVRIERAASKSSNTTSRVVERSDGRPYTVRVRDLPPAEQAAALNEILEAPQTVTCPGCGRDVSDLFPT